MKIVVTEEQNRILVRQAIKEAMGKRFSFDYLSMCNDLDEMYAYCCETLGQPNGGRTPDMEFCDDEDIEEFSSKGSSRVVFQLTDNLVLKLALNAAGCAQNEHEYDGDDQFSYDIFPKIDEDDSDLDSFSWLVCEYVLPAAVDDFEKVLGVDWETVCDIIMTIYAQYARGRDGEGCKRMSWDKLGEYVENSDFFQELNSYMSNAWVNGRELTSINNWGMTRRGNQTQMVILDSGLNDYIYQQYYARRR